MPRLPTGTHTASALARPLTSAGSVSLAHVSLSCVAMSTEMSVSDMLTALVVSLKPLE